MDDAWRAVVTPRRLSKRDELKKVVAELANEPALELGADADARGVTCYAIGRVPEGTDVLSRASDEFSFSAPRGLCRTATARLERLGASRGVIDECGRRFWRSVDGGEVAVPTSAVGWLTHGLAQYCATAPSGANARAEAGGRCVTTRALDAGERLVVDFSNISRDVRTSGGWVGATATRADDDERGDDLLRWLAKAAPCGLRATSDGSLGVFALESITKGQKIDLSTRRVDEAVRGRPLACEAVHGKVAKAFRAHGDTGARTLERLRRKFPFSHTYQTLPMNGSLVETTTLGSLRHSSEPTLAPFERRGLTAQFMATRDVAAGEELTVDRALVCTLESPGTGGFREFYEYHVEGKMPPWQRAGEGVRARGGIDYSKWDDVASSSEESDHD